jgi:hypothetical protein
MRIKSWLISLSLLSTVGCSCMNNTEKGMLGGAALGTGAGALIGRGNPAAMVLGGVAGTMVGGLAGNAQDHREDRKAWAQASANAHAARQMSINEVVQLSQQRVPDQMIVNQMNTTGSTFDLRGDDLTYLRQQGVSDHVITQMQIRRGGQPVVMHPAPRVVYVEPPPPPPHVSVGVGFGR